jgi:hypothetical protein
MWVKICGLKYGFEPKRIKMLLKVMKSDMCEI